MEDTLKCANPHGLVARVQALTTTPTTTRRWSGTAAEVLVRLVAERQSYVHGGRTLTTLITKHKHTRNSRNLQCIFCRSRSRGLWCMRTHTCLNVLLCVDERNKYKMQKNKRELKKLGLLFYATNRSQITQIK